MNHSDSVTFNQLPQNYIDKLKDAFQLFDDDGDGLINGEDLKKALLSVGKANISDEFVSGMLEGHSSITFAQFLGIMSRRSGEFDENTIEDSFKELSSSDTLEIDNETLLKYLKECGMAEDKESLDKILQTFSKKHTFNGKQYLDTISEN